MTVRRRPCKFAFQDVLKLIVAFDFLGVSGAAARHRARTSAMARCIVNVSIRSLLGSGLRSGLLSTLLFLAVDGGSWSIVDIGNV